ncbi:MAG: cache domain-containing protein [candidate division NC10 bacterium]|nr:cache domain-containing protein [candidate division NC10 bacterium]
MNLLILPAFHHEANRRATCRYCPPANAAREHFEGLTRYVESFARRPLLAAFVQSKNTEGIRAHLKDLVTQHGSLDRAFITDPRGRLWYDYPHAPEVIGQDFSFRDWYRGVSGTQTTYVFEVYQRAAPPQPYLVAIATPIRNARQQPLGYLVAQHTLATLTDWLAEVRPSRGGAVALIVRDQGRRPAPALPGIRPA